MKRTSVVSAALLALFGAIAVYLLWVSLPWPLIHDAPIMHYIAWRIAHGAVPYRDLFDMNQPGAYVIHLGVLTLLGDGDVAWRVFDVAWLALGAGAIAWFAAPWGRVAAMGGALCFGVYHLSDGAWQAGQRDYLLSPLLIGAAAGVARWIETDRLARSSLAVSGLALGVAITIKPHTAVLALAFAVVIAVVAWRRPAIASSIAIYTGSLAVAPVAIASWLTSAGALGAWREIVFDYLLPLYSRLGRPADWTFHRWHVWIAIVAAVAFSLGSAAWYGRFTARHGLGVIGLGYGLIHFFGQGKGWEYHLYPLAAFAAALAFSEIDIVFRGRRLVPASVLVAALVATALLLGQKGAEAASAEWVWDKERIVRWITWDLIPRIQPADTVQVLDTTEGGIHALLRLHTLEPTRFLYDFHFFHDTDHPVIRRLRGEFMRDVTQRPPRFVVLLERGWPNGRADRIRNFPELARWLDESYAVLQRRDGYVIFAKRHDS